MEEIPIDLFTDRVIMQQYDGGAGHVLTQYVSLDVPTIGTVTVTAEVIDGKVTLIIRNDFWKNTDQIEIHDGYGCDMITTQLKEEI